MRTAEFNLQIVTPLFMGNAYQKAELRSQSFNGLIRYWYRLLGGNLETENKLFGTTNKEKSSKGKINIRIPSQNLRIKNFTKQLDNQGRPVLGSGINYLGFSLHTQPRNRPEVKREYIDLQQSFRLIFSFHPTLTEDDIKQFLCAFWCSLYLGNFGSRNRRGFGSIISMEEPKFQNLSLGDFKLSFKINKGLREWYTEQLEVIKNLKCWNKREGIPFIFQNLEIYRLRKENQQNYRSWIQKIQKNRTGKYLVKHPSTLDKHNDNAMKLLDYMGFLLSAYRSYYNPDYTQVKGYLQKGSARSIQINRVVFGLPLNFYYSSIISENPDDKRFSIDKNRRASPILIKILRLDTNHEGLFIIFNPIVGGKYTYYYDLHSKNNWDKIYLPNRNIEIKFDGFKTIIDFIASLLDEKIIEKIEFRR